MTTYLVGIYNSDRVYGGSEEGGWWYDTGTLSRYCKVEFNNASVAHNYRNRLQQKLNRTKYNSRGFYSDLGSVLCDGKYVAKVFEDALPIVYPTEIPYYH